MTKVVRVAFECAECGQYRVKTIEVDDNYKGWTLWIDKIPACKIHKELFPWWDDEFTESA